MTALLALLQCVAAAWLATIGIYYEEDGSLGFLWKPSATAILLLLSAANTLL